jgi:hypothetical protein
MELASCWGRFVAFKESDPLKRFAVDVSDVVSEVGEALQRLGKDKS